MKKSFLFITAVLFLSNIEAKTYSYGNSSTSYNKAQTTKALTQPKQAKSAVSVQSDISFTEINLPYNGENLPFNEENVQRANFDLLDGQEFPFVGYTFTLTEAKNLYISSNKDIFIIISNSPTLTQESAVVWYQPSEVPDAYPRLQTGTYYLFVVYFQTGINYSLYVQTVVTENDYTRLDYSKFLSTETPIYGEINNDTKMIYALNANAPGESFSLVLEENKTYNIVFSVYLKNPNDNFWAEIALYNENFELINWQNDFSINFSDKTNLCINYFHTSTETETVRLLFLAGTFDALYKIEITEIETPQPYISVADLLTNAKRITALPYSDNGIFNENSTLVIGDDREFQVSRFKYYASAYKIELSENEKINIYNYLQSTAFIMIYKAGGIDGYTYVDRNIDFDVQRADDAYFEFTAPEGGTYYIIARSRAAFNFSRTGIFYIDVWANGTAQPENEYKNLTITSLAANKTNINANKNLSDTELLLLLSDLQMTGITDNGIEVPVANNPFAWEIGRNGNTITAYFYPINSNYTIDESLYAMVTIQMPVSDINEVVLEKEILKEEYFGFDGKPLRAKNISPLHIKHTIYTDGSTKTDKIIEIK
ncbi:MAG: hypothetical protein LBN27_13380 [Prevotellaceae bacterium]|jgi:hypothetical protein|nr:hypothetical protein [Prevotellaceae bacterium]